MALDTLAQRGTNNKGKNDFTECHVLHGKGTCKESMKKFMDMVIFNILTEQIN